MSLCSSGVQRNAIVLLRLRALFSHGILLTPSLRQGRRAISSCFEGNRCA